MFSRGCGSQHQLLQKYSTRFRFAGPWLLVFMDMQETGQLLCPGCWRENRHGVYGIGAQGLEPWVMWGPVPFLDFSFWIRVGLWGGKGALAGREWLLPAPVGLLLLLLFLRILCQAYCRTLSG